MKIKSKIAERIEDWTLCQFIALLLLHAAHADLDYAVEERLEILNIISEEELRSLEQYYQMKTDGHIINIILKYKSYFLDSSQKKQKALDHLKLIHEVDGETSKLEQTQYEFLSRLITEIHT